MIIVYVKHYLSSQGFEYFSKTWFPKMVQPVISKQQGFISIEAKINEHHGYAFITVKFDSASNLEKWIAKPEHDVVDNLDDFRTRNYWEAVRTENESDKPEMLSWKKIPAKKSKLSTYNSF